VWLAVLHCGQRDCYGCVDIGRGYADGGWVMKENEFVVTRQYHDDGSPPTTALVPRSSYVAARPQVDSAAIQRVADTALAPGDVDGSSIGNMRTISEVSTPVDRAWAVVIQGVFICLLTGIATYALTLAGASSGQVVAFFLVLLIVGVGLVIWLSYSHSPIGNERYKANLYKDIQLAKVDAFREFVGVVYGRDTDA
jgi:hypothetical protein